MPRAAQWPRPVVAGHFAVADVAVPYGNGKLVPSSLRLPDAPGRDPVADGLLCNIIEWARGMAARE